MTVALQAMSVVSNDCFSRLILTAGVVIAMFFIITITTTTTTLHMSVSKQKTIHEKGESGQTWRGLIEWIKKAQPPLVILENVKNAPWDVKVEIFQSMGYHAQYVHLDTKKY